jgi:hypothetical protein
MFAANLVSKGSPILKRFAPAALAIAFVVGSQVAPASASSLADYYRTMYTMKFCNVIAEGDEEQSINVAVEQEVVDNQATSEDIAPIFDELNAEYNADPDAFCKKNTTDAQQVLDNQN